MTAIQERGPAAAPVSPLRPSRYLVAARKEETGDTVTLLLRPAGTPILVPRPGQFTMLYAYGVGEVPVSVSGIGGAGQVIVQTIRAVGAVTRALCAAAPGDMIGVRGPFGTDLGVSGAARRRRRDRRGRHRARAAAAGAAGRAGGAGPGPGGAAGRRAVTRGPDLHPRARHLAQARRRRPFPRRPGKQSPFALH